MKSLLKSIILLSATAILVNLAWAQSIQVPQQVKTAFEKKFHKVTKVKWEKEEGNLYEAEFKVKGTEYSVVFDDKGTWIETEHEIKVKELPQAILNSVKDAFTGYEIEEAEIIENQSGTVYEIELENKNQTLEVIFNANGNILKKEIENEENDIEKE